MQIPFENIGERVRFFGILGIVLLLVVVGIPVATFFITHREFQHLGERAALAYARSVIERSDRISTQIAVELSALEAAQGGAPCSPENVRLMRQTALRSVDIMLIGYQQDDRLLCSSFGVHEGGIPLGPVDFSGAFNMRRNIQLDLAPGAVFNAGERNGWVFFLARTQSIDVAVPSTIALATFSTQARQLRASRGFIRPEWIAQARSSGEVSFVDGGYAVGVIHSEAYPSGAMAAVPLAIFSPSARMTEQVATGVAVLAGLSLAAWVLYVARQFRIISPLSLKRALRRGEFYMVYQPIVDLHSRAWVGAEALMRWRRGGIEIPPDLFFSVAERKRMMEAFTGKMLTLVGRDAAAVLSASEGFYLSLNLTAADLKGTAIVVELQRLAGLCGVPASRFKVEITERNVLDEKDAKDTLEALRTSGIDTMIDDFGTGFSNLKYLSVFTFDYLKVDRAFTAGLGSDSVSGDVALHIVKLAMSLGIGLVAEGIETERQAELLTENGVRYWQGWLFSRPRLPADLVAGLREQAST
jgi:sensor c-di-GMP phosphodiesterase-like protein